MTYMDEHIHEHRDMVIGEIRNELNRAMTKHPNAAKMSQHHGFAVLKEEVDELWDDVKSDNRVGARKEAIQVAAMAIRFILECTP